MSNYIQCEEESGLSSLKREYEFELVISTSPVRLIKQQTQTALLLELILRFPVERNR
jgi:hypothetical protein